jgi:hypothetical protein
MLKIATNNAAQRVATLIGNDYPAYPVSNMLVDVKSLVHRSTPLILSNTISATWTTPETVGVVCLPFCNLTPTATIRVQVYSDTAGTTLAYDSGAGVLACPAPSVVLPGFTAAQAAQAYAFGGGAYARHWFTPVTCGKLVITLSDGLNLQGYVETSRLFVANWWSPSYNADVGATLTFDSASSQVRSDGGDLYTNIGPRMRKLAMKLTNLPGTDRANLAAIMRASGLDSPLLVSLFPGDTDTALERDYTIYGKLSSLSALAWGTVGTTSLPLEIVEM